RTVRTVSVSATRDATFTLPCPSCGTATPASAAACEPCGAAVELVVRSVERWRGYATSSFILREADGFASVESPAFRWRKPTPPPDNPKTRGALDALVGQLASEGWALVGEARVARRWSRAGRENRCASSGSPIRAAGQAAGRARPRHA